MAAKRDYPDHARVLTLLWRSGQEPSARSGLTVGRIVAAAIGIADEEGLGSLSMRRVAERLGVGTMSLYTYVPGKDELVLLMVDKVYGELPKEAREGVGWRQRLQAIAHEYWDLYQRHRWLMDVPVSRPVVGPNLLDRTEYELGAVDGIGLDDLEMNAVLELVQGHVAGTARRGLDISRDAERSGMSDEEWWYSVLPTLTAVLADRFYPLNARVGSAIGAPHMDVRYGLEFGLDRILDGIEALVASRSSS
jgi:AcrR family transcriptional regulator